MQRPIPPSGRLAPYVPRLVSQWLREEPDATFRELPGSMAFVDISGFTMLSERLARRGKVGAEILTERLGSSFAELLAVAYENGGGLIKFGGDALLLWFSDEGHEVRASRAALGMRRVLRRMGRLETIAGAVSLRMSVGIHSGRFLFFLVGGSHRELILTGPAATTTVLMESTASAGEIVMSAGTAAALPVRSRGGARGRGWLLSGMPPARSGAATAFEPEAPPDVTQAIPVAIREHLAAGAEDAEHKAITVAFIHFGGTDLVVERSGPAILAEKLNTLIAAVQRASESHGVAFLGSDVASDGGKVILTAGAPRATGNHDERMLLTLRQIMDGPPALPLSVGVHRGHVFAGDVGPQYRRTYTVMGDTVNLAARLMAAAPQGRILASDAVAAQARGRLEMTQLEPFTVKGKSRPVQAHAVGAVLASRSERALDDQAMIGRAEELEILLAGLRAARARSGAAIELVGEAGIGKSRLVNEIRELAADAAVLSLACDPYESSTPYFLFRQLLRSALGIEPGDGQGLVELRLRQRVAADAPELTPWLPLLGTPLELVIPSTEETRALEDGFRQAKLAEVANRFLAHTLPTPTLLMVEDAQWMDDASGELLAALAADVGHQPWLILVTRRDLSSGFALRAPGSRSVAVLPLPQAEAVALAESMTEALPLSPHVIAGLVERSGGNPLFLRELLAAVRAGAMESFPGSVEDLIAARIDQLAPADRALLRQASVLGSGFDEGLLASVLPDGARRPRGDTWARLSHFIERLSGGGFKFRQTLIRDAAYEGLAYRTRRDLHARVGEFILQATPNPEEQSALLAMHFYHAGRYEEAWRFARIAGDRARAAYANVEAASLYRQALDAGRFVRDVPAEQFAAVQEALGDVCDRLGEYRGAEVAYRSARRHMAAEPSAVARLLLKEAGIPERVGRYSQALRLIARGHRALEGLGGRDADRERARLSAAYASIRQAQGRHKEAIRWCRQAISEAEGAGDRDALAHAYAILSWAFASTGHADSGRYSRLSLAIYEELGNLGRQALVLNYLGAFAYFDGHWDEALDYYERGRAARERTGDAVGAAYGTINLGEILSDQGHLETAESFFRAALRVWKAAGYRAGAADALSQLGRAASRRGEFDQALSLLAEARSIHQDVGAQAWVLEDDSRLAECHLLGGDPLRALSLADATLAAATGQEGGGVQAILLQRIRGQALMALGRHESAREALEKSLRLARARGAEFEVALTLRALAEMLRSDGVTESEVAPLEAESSSVLTRLGVVAVPAPPAKAARPEQTSARPE